MRSRSFLSLLPACRRALYLSLLAASLATASLHSPAAHAAEPRTLTAVMHSPIRILDPIITTAHIVRNHGYMI